MTCNNHHDGLWLVSHRIGTSMQTSVRIRCHLRKISLKYLHAKESWPLFWCEMLKVVRYTPCLSPTHCAKHLFPLALNHSAILNSVRAAPRTGARVTTSGPNMAWWWRSNIIYKPARGWYSFFRVVIYTVHTNISVSPPQLCLCSTTQPFPTVVFLYYIQYPSSKWTVPLCPIM